MSDTTMNPDVLSQVFETAVDANPSSLSTIRSVNREWFETAGNTPKLWSKLNLDRKIHFTDPDYVLLHLQNSGGIPLEVTITLPDDVPYESDIPALAELKKATDKIRSLIIDVPYHEAWQKLVFGIGEGQPAPLLERLVLRVKGDVNDFRKNGPFTTLSTAFTPSPKLVHLQLPAWPLPAQPPPQLATVTTLVFDTPFSGLDIPAIFPLVQAATHLQHFTFKAVDMGAESDPSYSNVISLPGLRSADVTSPGFGLDLLGNFNAPQLTNVRLDGYREVVPESAWADDDWGIDLSEPASRILSRLSARSPKISRLELKYIPFENPKEEYKRLLSGQTLPLLEELILERTNIPDASLIDSAGGHSNLKKLKLRNCKYVSAKGLRSFAQEIAKTDLVLSVEGCPGINQEDAEALSKTVRA